MNILFLHRSFPGQFKYLASELAKDNDVIFITNSQLYEIDGVKKIIYSPEPFSVDDVYFKPYKSAIEQGKAAAKLALELKSKGWIPDVIYGHSGWGPTMFMKDIFPDVPLLCYFEWFQNADGADTGFGGAIINEYQRAGLRCANSQVLIDLYTCDCGISPTLWQKEQFPKEFHNKIEVIHDGIETDFFKPDDSAAFLIKDKNLTLTAKDEVITYATRGMEPYRGFPQFMEAVEKLQKLRPNAHFIVAGEDKVFYRGKLEEGTYKELMLNNLDINLDKIHFVGPLPYIDYLKLLQISSLHVYLTVPYVLSWSLLEAMSVGCCIVASNTAPVLEAIKDNYNGLLTDFYDIDSMISKIEYALNNQSKMDEIRENARKTVLNDFNLVDCLSKQIDYIKKAIQKV